MTRSTALVAALACLVACGKEYKVRVNLTGPATDQRLASGKSDTIDGKLRRADATSVYIDVDGQTEAIPRADIAGIDDHFAKRDVRNGTIGIVVGGLISVGGFLFFDDCGDSGPLCPFKSKRNFYAGFAVVGGLALASAGLGLLFSGMSGTSHTQEVMGSSAHAMRWRIAPIVVQGDRSVAPGIGLAIGD